MWLGFSDIHDHWTGAMSAHVCMIPTYIEEDCRYGVLRQVNLGKRFLQVLHMILHATPNSSRDAVVEHRVFREENSVCIPVAII